MAESTLNLSKQDLDSEVGTFAGFGPGDNFGGTEWNDDQTERIRRAVNTGLRMVYFTQQLAGPDGRTMIPGGFDWSFLKPVAEITLLSGANTVDMPDDFGGILGRVIPASPTGVGAMFPIQIVGESDMYASEAVTPSASGRPSWALVEQSKATSATRSTRVKLRFYPTADQDYTLKVWYFILPNAITDAMPYVYGGAQHAETFKYACRAAYEKEYDGGPGAQYGEFIERLKASIAFDRKMKPVELGRNRDTSDDSWQSYGGHYGNIGFDVNGTTPAVWSAY